MTVFIVDGKKPCSKCKETKPVSAFNTCKIAKCGLLSQCKACISAVNVPRVKAYAAANPEKVRAASKAAYYAHKDERAAKRKAWAELNRDKTRENNRRYRSRHKERVNAAARERERLNPDARKAARIKYAKANPDVCRAVVRNRRAKIKQVHGRIGKGLEPSLLEKQRWKCAVCKVDLRKAGHHMDHMTPIARGGRHEAANLQMLCPPCNLSKGAKDEIDFMQSRGFLL